MFTEPFQLHRPGPIEFPLGPTQYRIGAIIGPVDIGEWNCSIILRFHSPFFEWNGPESVTERGFDSIGPTFFRPNNWADLLQHAPRTGGFHR